ncbi:MAG: sugar nucleotide-binding protein [Candidatus Omnitrophica bacterium]|nr:sugar nucleotide-binding protein [Candidatus Omnitrophota bacterium]MDD5652667.1 sugar nucleotide-binding protein [Candidatus Omnitrophota bacterium]
MNEKILILGKGFLASRLKEELDSEVSGARIYSFADADAEISKFNPTVLINCIGHIGGNVDACELDKDKALMANSFVPLMLAEVCIRRKIRFVHISSGCIYHYDYKKNVPLKEEEAPDFFELFYSRTKIYSEQPIDNLSRQYPILILRLRVPLDNRPHPRNLLTKLISYGKIIDLPNSVTYIPDFLKATRHLLEINATGIYNVVNKEPLRYRDLMEAYKRKVKGFQYEEIEFNKLNLVRTNLVMSTEKLEKTGFKVRTINEVLEECVEGYLKS